MFELEYHISPKILNNISQIEAAKQIVENSPLLPFYERQFKNEAIIRAVHYSTHIEGNRLNINEAKQILKGTRDNFEGKERDYKDIINYRNVLKYIEKIQASYLKMSHVFQVHRIVVKDLLDEKYQGVFRKQQVIIKNSQTNQVSYVPPSFLEVQSMMNDLLGWMKAQNRELLHPVIKAGIFHCYFVKIHPFVDGNGRTARALTTLSLYLDGFDIKKFFCLDEYYDQNLKDYYKALQSVDEFAKDYTIWLEYFTEGLLKEFLRIKNKVLKISRDQKIKKSIGQIYLSERQERIIEYIQEVGRLQNQDFRKVLPDVSEDTVLRDIKELLKKKVIHKRGTTKASYYELLT